MGMKSRTLQHLLHIIVSIHTDLRDGGVDCEVCVRLDADTEIAVVITKASAENLGLTIGKDVFALVKSSSVMLSVDPGTKACAFFKSFSVILAVLN